MHTKILYFNTLDGSRVEFWLSEDNEVLTLIHVGKDEKILNESVMHRLEKKPGLSKGKKGFPIPSAMSVDDPELAYAIYKRREGESVIYEVLHPGYTIQTNQKKVVVPEQEVGFYRFVSWQ